MTQTLHRLVGELKAASDEIATGAREIALGNQDLSGRTEQQAANLQETAASMEQLTSTVRQTTETSQQANQLAVQASSVAAQGAAVMQDVISSMDHIASSSRKIGDTRCSMLRVVKLLIRPMTTTMANDRASFWPILSLANMKKAWKQGETPIYRSRSRLSRLHVVSIAETDYFSRLSFLRHWLAG